ncbi:lamin tail domain-containing protein [Aeoliella mucimassa]|uniref:CotH protein n=1 Tax=Aeoliella mucimassa TaxID=2527972 RepID=A0A518AP97_9BACT|nr:lamin tail domain-containing protein [Aeoliella mucimassa]QDU56553.1 CotH protein [Aeoliella mucimassa]
MAVFRKRHHNSRTKSHASRRNRGSRLRMEQLEDRRLLAVVINEIHYNSADNTSFEEFIELYNTSSEPVDLSGWEFTDGIDYTFAEGQTIAGNGYVVLAQDPATLLSEFGTVATGMYAGGLSNGGERVALSDSSGNLIDEVEYSTTFPWPISPDGEGMSMELVNPNLDNNLGSNWRPAFTEPLFASPDDGSTSDLVSGLVHRWSFSGNLEDSVGGDDATLVDPAGITEFVNGRLDVSRNSGQLSNQVPFESGAYVDLPNGIISDLGESATFEWWGTVTRNRTWAEIFSFGTSDGGEDSSSSASGQSYITLIPRADSGDLRLSHRNGTTSVETSIDWSQSPNTNTEYHFAVVWDGASDTQSLYVNGQLVGQSSTTLDLADLNDNNNWLGRSQWNDPLFDGYHNEFRIYNQALSSSALAESYEAGPNAVFAGPTINSFEANQSSIVSGETVVLTWNVTDATSLTITPDVGDVTNRSGTTVSPTETTTYVLIATNNEGTTSRAVTITVEPQRATPGAANATLADNAAPAIASIDTSGGDTSESIGVVTAEVSDPDGVASVELQYQIVLPGEYIPARLPVDVDALVANATLLPTANPEYFDLANWTTIVMVDDGTGEDAVAGDGIYTASIPAQAHRTLVRYRIEVSDTLGATAMAPYADDASLNFAYFVYDGIPDYVDNNNQLLADADALDSLPVYHLLTRAEDIAEANAWDSDDQIPQGTEARYTFNWGGTIVYNGKVYDNIQYRPRGANGRYYGEGKRSMRFRFNDGNWFEPLDQDGEPYPEQWKTLTTGKGFDNHSTLTYSLNEAITLQLSNMLGLPAIETHWFQFRVIDDSAEAPDQWNGDFWGINFALEDYDKRFLDAHDLEEGNLYKLNNQTQDAERQLDYQAPNAVSDGSDFNYVEYAMGRASDKIEYRVDLEKYFIYHALSEAVRHYDYWPTANKNMAYYFAPNYTAEKDYKGELWLLLWDTDASWGPTWNEGKDLVYDALFENFDPSYADSLIKPAYYNTLRELRDLIWQPDQLEGMINELVSNILPLEAADRARWQGAPDSAGNYDGLSGAGSVSLSNLVQDMLNFAFVGGNWPSGGTNSTGYVGPGGRAAYLDDQLVNSGEEALIPETPVITYVGDPGMAADELAFEATTFADPQGNNTFGAMEWRISQVTPVSAGLDTDLEFLDEWTASWTSGELTTYSSTIAPSSSAVTAGEIYRARVRYQDDTGRWSHWSDPVEFVAAEANGSTTLAITELHYHPNNSSLVDEDDQEFIEILNTGSTTIDLTGVQITDFASTPYVFSPGQMLAPGEYMVIARTPEVFEAVYGTNVNLALDGFGDRNLSNGGETISLLDASGNVIQSFTYSDDTPWPTTADGDGPSLEIIDPLGDANDPLNWRASRYDGGSPGVEALSIPGDYDLSGVVDQNDYLLWKSQIGSRVAIAGAGADGNRDGVVSLGDYTIWRDNLGAIAEVASIGSPEVAAVSSTTEPAAPPVVVEILEPEQEQELQAEPQEYLPTDPSPAPAADAQTTNSTTTTLPQVAQMQLPASSGSQARQVAIEQLFSNSDPTDPALLWAPRFARRHEVRQSSVDQSPRKLVATPAAVDSLDSQDLEIDWRWQLSTKRR